MDCERCGAEPRRMDLLDYCAICFTDLCEDCMKEGCCGHVPALSGVAAEPEEEED